MKKISRRDFLKGSAALAATGILGSCTGKSDIHGATTESTSETTKVATVPETETTTTGTAAPEAETTPTTGQNPDSSKKVDTKETARPHEGEVMILFTNDIHCGVDEGFGYAGLKSIRDNLEESGYTTILVDNGDAIQGDSIGALSKGENIIDIMNDLKYDIAIPGNHEFDYGVDQFLSLVKKANFPYISCNFRKNGNLVMEPYIIKEAAGIKIAFVGVTTPKTITSSTPKYFQDEHGNYIYDFMQGDTGDEVYAAVQNAVDSARAEGADYVYVMAHVGLGNEYHPWEYTDIIANTTGIDVFMDGHSHDTEQVVMKNKDGKDVVRSSCGTKFICIGHSNITKDGIKDTNIWTWSNNISIPDLLGIHNDIYYKIKDTLDEINRELGVPIAVSECDLYVFDPVLKTLDGIPINVNRISETNIGDLCTDAVRAHAHTDIAIINSGSIRQDINKGDVSRKDLITTMPFSNYLCTARVPGQKILDTLEWSVKDLPDANGGFLQVSGLIFDVDVSVPSGCKSDSNGMCTSIDGERRVKNVKVGDKPLDPDALYTVAGSDYVLKDSGDGNTSFNDCDVSEYNDIDFVDMLQDYILHDLDGVIGSQYSDPHGQGRINIIDE